MGWGFSAKKKDKNNPPSSNLGSATTNTLSTTVASQTVTTSSLPPSEKSPSVGSNASSQAVSTMSPPIGTNAPAITSSTPQTTPSVVVRRSCEGVIPLKDSVIKRQLDMIFRYCPHSRQGSNYVLKLLGGLQANVYTTVCDGVGIIRHDKRSPGIRCDSCNDLWNKSGSKIKSTVVKRKAEKIIEVLTALHATMMTEDHYRILDNFSRNKNADLNEQGIELKHKANAFKEFYKEITSVSAFLLQSQSGIISVCVSKNIVTMLLL